MTFLGLRDGIALQFTDGILSHIALGRSDRSIELHEELSMSAQPMGEPIPYLPLEASLDISDARYRGLDPYSGRQVHQRLAGGQRTISILQGQSLLASGLPEVQVARVHIDVSLSQHLVWKLTSSEAAWASDEAGAETSLGQGCTIRVSSTALLAIEDKGRTLRVDMPAGVSTVEMWVEGQPPLRLAPAVILCTSSQVREAAVVASAVGSKDGAYIPVLDLELPPLSRDEFQTANNRLRDLTEQLEQVEQKITTVAQQGVEAPGGIVLPGAQAAEQSIQQLTSQRESLLREIEPLQQRVLAYGAWSSRTTIVSRLIASLTAGAVESPRLFVLAPYPADIMVDWMTAAEIVMLFPERMASEASLWQRSIQGALAEQVRIILWKDVQDLVRQVWALMRGQLEPAFFTIPDEASFYIVGLVDALRRGRALLPRGRPGPTVNLEQIQDDLNAGVTSDHAIVVEADNSIASLVGALYAHHIGARLYVNSVPRFDQAFGRMRVITESVQKEQLSALAASAYRYIGEHRKQFMQSQTADPQLKQVAAGLSILELPTTVPTPYSDAAFVQALTTYLTAQRAGAQQGYRYDDEQWRKDLAGLEAEVSVGVSEYVRQAIDGAARLTFFTGGLPYSLATACQGKAVGLVLREMAAPFILRTVAQSSVRRPSLGLALVVDPGLQQRPAPDVPQVVDRTLTLRAAAASLDNLAALASLLPLDVVLLHTQGNVDTLILADARGRLLERHASTVGSQVHLASHPLVIYSAPLAWLSVGLTLLEQGAGGFLGVLWPVDNGAEDVVRSVIAAAMSAGQNPADALVHTPAFDPRTSRAFVYLGTATPWAATTGNANVIDGAPALYAAAARLAAMRRQAAADLVYDRLRVLTGELAAGDPALRAELLLLDADYAARLSAHLRERPPQERLDKIAQTLETLEKMSLPEDYKRELQIAMQERAAMLEMAAENLERAEDLLRDARDARRRNGQTAGALSAAYLLALVQERRRQFSAARQTLLDLQPELASLGSGVASVRVAISLAYVSLPLAMYPDVLNHLKLAVQTSLALGVQILSETLMEVVAIGKAMTQAGARAEVVTLSRDLATVVRADKTLPEGERNAIADVLDIMKDTAEVLQAALSPQEREEKLAPLVEKAQANDLARTLGMDAWILSAGAPPARPQADEQQQTEA